MPEWEVGQKAILVTSGYRGNVRHQETVVTKVARKYVYIEQYGRQVGFDKETGAVQGSYTGYGTDHLYTPEMLARKELRERTVKRLRDVHSLAGKNFEFKQDTDTLVSMLELLDSKLPEKNPFK